MLIDMLGILFMNNGNKYGLYLHWIFVIELLCVCKDLCGELLHKFVYFSKLL